MIAPMIADPSLENVTDSNPSPVLPEAPRVTSQELLKGGRELLIEHAGQIYRLRLTRHGKLILNK
jgi:hemin uptake protein HemP